LQIFNTAKEKPMTTNIREGAMTPAEENIFVAALLGAAGNAGDVEIAGAAVPVEAYRSLARSRGLTLEQVLRAMCRDELPEVVAVPPVTVKRRRAPRRPARVTVPSSESVR
jgi:hypothetical protein